MSTAPCGSCSSFQRCRPSLKPSCHIRSLGLRGAYGHLHSTASAGNWLPQLKPSYHQRLFRIVVKLRAAFVPAGEPPVMRSAAAFVWVLALTALTACLVATVVGALFQGVRWCSACNAHRLTPIAKFNKAEKAEAPAPRQQSSRNPFYNTGQVSEHIERAVATGHIDRVTHKPFPNPKWRKVHGPKDRTVVFAPH